MKTISEEGLKLIKNFEGCRLTAYDDLQPNVVLTPSTKIKGTLTIGWGHTANVNVGQSISQAEADRLLLQDLQSYINAVNNVRNVPFTKELNQNQFDALVSFCYNCGPGNLKTLCNYRTISDIPSKILLYNKSKGKTLQGLVRRREAEKQLFEKVVADSNKTNNSDTARIIELEEKVKSIVTTLTKISDRLNEVPAPEWFTKEFPDALELIHQKTGTIDFWRSFAIALRIVEIKSK